MVGGDTVKRETTFISVIRLGNENMHINISLRRRYGITSTRNSYLCLIQKEKQGTAIQRDANVGQLQTFNTVSERSDVKEQENGN